jgi:hypothetical protein
MKGPALENTASGAERPWSDEWPRPQSTAAIAAQRRSDSLPWRTVQKQSCPQAQDKTDRLASFSVASGREGFGYGKRLPIRAESHPGKRRHESLVFRRGSERFQILLTRLPLGHYYRTLGHGSLPYWLWRSLWR